MQNVSPLKLKKRIFNQNIIASLKDQISKVNWDWLNLIESSTNNLYEIFGNIFSETYNVNFTFTETEMKLKNMRMP